MRFSGVLVCALLGGCTTSPEYTLISQSEREFSQVYDAPDLSRSEIYDGSLRWIAENFKSAKSVLEYQNPTDGVMIGNGAINYPCAGLDCVGKGEWRVKFTMKVETKDGKFKTDFKNLVLSLSDGGEVPVQTKADLDAIKPVLLNFGNEMKHSFVSNKSDW